MQLLTPSPGFCCDRQVILVLKCKAGQAKGMNVQTFVEEINQLQSYLEKNWFLLAPKSIQNDYDTAYKELETVNEQLWKLEDRIRVYVKVGANNDPDLDLNQPQVLQDIKEIALAIPRLNDVRAGLVGRINALFGITGTGEKIYQ